MNDKIKEIAELLSKQKKEVIFFVGAGISSLAPSRLPTSKVFKREVTDILFTDSRGSLERIRERLYPLVDAIPQEEMFQWIYDCFKDSTLGAFDVFDSNAPNNNHMTLALMADLGLIDNVVTTNFDPLLEEAMNKYLHSTNFYVCYKDDEFNIKQGVGIFKFHGTIKDKKSLTAILTHVGKGLSPQKARLLKKFLEENIIVFVGYSASDLDIWNVIYSSNVRESIWIMKPNSNNRNIPKIIDACNGRLIFYDLNKFFMDLANYLHLQIITPPENAFNMKCNKIILTDWADKFEDIGRIFISGNILSHFGLYHDALACYDSSIKILENLATPPKFLHFLEGIDNWKELLKIQVIASAGTTYNLMGNLESALKCMNETMLIYNGLGKAKPISSLSLIRSLGTLADVQRLMGNYKRALQLFQDAIRIAKAMEDEEGLIKLYNNMALLYQNMRFFKDAIHNLESAQVLAEKHGDLSSLIEIKHTYGSVAHMEGNFDMAIKMYNEAIDFLKEYPDIKRKASILRDRGLIYMELRDFNSADEDFKVAYSIYSNKIITDSLGAAKVLMYKGIVEKEKGNLASALEKYGECIYTFQKLKDLPNTGYCYGNISSVYFILKDFNVAKRYAKKTLWIFKLMKDEHGIARCYERLGSISWQKGNPIEAIMFYIEAIKVYRKVGDPVRENIAKTNIDKVISVIGS